MRNWRNSICKTGGRLAITLIEVLASLVILSMFLTTILVAQSRHVRQIRKSEQTNRAIELTDQLIAGWFESSDEKISIGKPTVFTGQSEFFWTALIVQRAPANAGWDAMIVQIETQSTKNRESDPLVSLQILWSSEAVE